MSIRSKKPLTQAQWEFNSVVRKALTLGEHSHHLHAKVLDSLKKGNTILQRPVNQALVRAPYDAGNILEKSVRRTTFVINNIDDIHSGVLKTIMGTQASPRKKTSVESSHMAFMVRAFKRGKSFEDVCTYFPQYTKAQIQKVHKLYTTGKIRLTWKRGAKVWS